MLACLLGGLFILVALLRFIPLEQLNPFAAQYLRKQKIIEAQAKERAEDERRRRLQAADKKISELMESSQRRMLEMIGESQAKAEIIITKQRNQIPKMADALKEKLEGYNNAVLLVKLMATDKVYGSHQTQDYLQSAFQPVFRSQAQAEGELRLLITDCNNSLNLEAAKLQASMAQVLNGEGFQSSDLGLEENLRRLSGDTTKHILQSSLGAIGATLEVGIEALLIRTTYETLCKLLAKVVTKEATSVTVGAAGAPFPVIDIFTTAIAVGGTIWTAWDVHKAVGELEKTEPVIRAGLTESVNLLKSNSDKAYSSLRQTVAELCNKKPAL